ncbi:response regulator [Cryomorpha ignava]|uniref:histidine kinase n=1 Tax=Cryomorpha ignava TaxID=101383 RepID=A0A7K3WKL7_9FLAO|nr:ATP-binding protein [Cryomorpha ignava]NEN22190.1 response regulator [Cryomorpha ignava]
MKRPIPFLVLFECLIHCFFISDLFAQSSLTANAEQYVQEEWTVENGLSVGHINQIYQTPDGYIWLATFNGLIRFDGLRFTLFDVSNTPELPSNRIVLLQPGQGNSFWLFTEQRDILHVENNRYLQHGPFLSIEHQRVILDGDSLSWVTSRSGLKKLVNDSLVPCTFAQLNSKDVLSVFRAKNGELIVTTKTGAIYKTRFPYSELIKIAEFSESNSTENVMEDREGSIYLYNNYVRKISDDSTLIFNQTNTTSENWSGVSPLYYNLMEDNNGVKWTITETGFFRLTQSGFKLIQKYNHVSPESSERQGAGMCKCSDGTVWAVVNKNVYKNGVEQFELNQNGATIFCDSEMSIWITNRINGVQRFSESLLKSYKSKESENNFYGIFQDYSGKIWFGEWIQSLYSLGKSEQVIEEPVAPDVGVTAAFAEDQKHNLYIGPYHIEDYDCRGCSNAKRLPGLPNEVFAIHPLSDSAIYFGTLQGLYFYDGEVGKQISDGDEIPDFAVRYILETSNSNLWLATNGSGVRNFNYATRKNKYYNTKNGLSSDNVRALMEDADGYIWAATEDVGLNRINPKTDEIVWIQKKDGLYEDGLHSLLLDDYNRLWMSTNQGIFWIDFAELSAFANGNEGKLRSTVYTERDGMPNREANGGFQNSAMKSEDGKLWFSTQKGVVCVDPSKINRNLPLPPVVIERISSNDSTLYLLEDELILSKDQQNLIIGFTTPSFLAPNRIRFKYRLAGFDTDWVESGSRREAIFTNLPAGNYKFEVASSYEGDFDNASITSFNIVKEPKLSERWWPWVLAVIVGLLIIYAILKWRLHQLHRQQLHLEKEVASRTRDLEAEKRITEAQKEKLLLLDREKSRFFANVSHEFRTPLTLIISPLRDLQNSASANNLTQYAKNQIDTGLKNATRLMRLVEQLLDIARLEAKKLQLDFQILEINEYIRDLGESFIGLAEVKHIKLKISIEDDRLFMRYDPDQLDKIVVNLLSNAFKFTPADGEIHLDLRSDNQLVFISVADTGRGLAPENLPHLFDRFFQVEKSELQPGSGIGLSIAKELTQLHDGKIEVSSEMGIGSTFTLSFPLVRREKNDPPVREAAHRDFAPHEAMIEFEADEPRIKTEDLNGDSAPKKTILIVDDNLDIRNYVADNFKADYDIVQAESGSEALNKITNHLPDLIISDVMMPDGDGLELLEAIRAEPEFAYLPVILLTAKAEVSDKLEGLKIGADDYLTKPFDIMELKLRVSNILLSRMRLQKYFLNTSSSEPIKIQSLSVNVPSQDTEFISQLGETIHQNFTDEAFSVEKLASLMGQSRSNLYRKVIALTDESPSETLKRVRLEHAAQLLKQNAGSISEIAYASGFNSISHFSKSFKIAYNVSPTVYSQE